MNYIAEMIRELQNAKTATEIQERANFFILLAKRNEELQAENDSLRAIIGVTPLDRVAEYCRTYSGIYKECYAILEDNELIKGQCYSLILLKSGISAYIAVTDGKYAGREFYVDTDRGFFFGKDAKEKAEARLKELEERELK